MDSYIDVSFHVIVSLLLGYIIFRLFGLSDRKSLLISFLFTFLGGVLIDVDHFIDHFLSFGINFNYDYFIKGEYFLKSNKAYIVFHAVEYIILSGLLAILLGDRKKKMIFTALALGMLFHILIDILLFPNPIKGYFILYRMLNGFNVDMSKGILE
ncbi:MAG: hypothetical protein AAB600_00220 [Patescibacteria group bacterium]